MHLFKKSLLTAMALGILGAVAPVSLAFGQVVIGTPTWSSVPYQKDGITMVDGTTVVVSVGWVFTGSGTCAAPGNWRYSSWAPSTGCGETTQIRSTTGCAASGPAVQSGTVNCVQLTKCPNGFQLLPNRGTQFCEVTDNEVIADSTCQGPKPAATQSCSGSAVNCGDQVTKQTASLSGGCSTPTPSYNWVEQGSCAGSGTWAYTSWSPNAVCGTITQTRTATCVGALPTLSVSCQSSAGGIVADSNCSGTKPDGSCTLSDASSCGAAGATSRLTSITSGCATAPAPSLAATPSTVTCDDSGTCSQTVTVTSSGNWLYLESFVSANAANFNEDAYTTTSPCDVLSSANKPCVITVHWQGGPQPPGGESLFVDYATCNGSVDSNTNLCAGPDFSDWDLKTGFGVEQIVAHVGSTNSPVSPSPSYSWQENNDWDSCTAGTMGFWAYTAWSPTCGTSTQTRSAACPGTSVGTQTQTVSCVLTDGSSATPSLCDPSTLPTTTRTCTLSTSSCGPLGSTSQSVTFNSCQPPPGSGTPSSGGTPSCTSNPATQVFCIIVPLI